MSGLDISFWQLGHFVIVIAYPLMLIQFKDFCPMECTRKLMQRLNQLFESEVEIPRIRHGKKQTLDRLINEEVLRLAKFLRNERKN